MFLGEECYFVVNESSLGEQNVKTLKALHEDLGCYLAQESLSWFDNPLFSWPLCLLVPNYVMFYFDAWHPPCSIPSVEDYHPH